MKPKILIIDDSSDFQKIVQHSLSNEYTVQAAGTLAAANDALMHELFDLILLDVNLPDGNGIEFLAMLKDRADLKNIPVFLVTAEDAAPKEIMGFKMGAQDYIHKPLDPSRLRARIEARLKPVDPALNRVTRGDLELDLESMRLFRNDQGILHEIPVTPIEFKLLLYMLKRGDSIFTRDQLLEAGWNDLTEVFDRTVDAHLSKLRKKLADTEVRIEPVRGVGYRIVQLTVKE